MKNPKRFQWTVAPAALQENIVPAVYARFTVLTPSLIRMEYSPSGCFEDRASQSVFYRSFPAVTYAVSRENGLLRVETGALVLTYKEGSPFQADTLSICLKKEPAWQWNYGEDFEDLGGTVCTLDKVNGGIPLERGVCSRNGFSVIDDSNTMLLDADGWVTVRMQNTVDVYFFGYGFDYIGAVQDFYRLTGIPPMLPAYALGNWWSRYYKYTQDEYLELMDRFREEDVPFSVSVVDMDWHITKIPQEFHDADDPLSGKGWSGYTWNRELFPDYKAFLRGLRERNLKTALNLHPHAGVRRFEDMYEEMARACGVDPASGKRIPFDILSPEFMEHYFDILHHPYENDGVDFWWMDWQQGKDYSWIHEPNTDGNMHDERETLDPLWMLNHLHILDISRNGERPMFFSRYSGPGSQRYPVGFSGDTIVTWDSLKFQPYFTATASNIGYSWWSHDIGGHMKGYRDDELNTRWIQLGVFSPINRLHSSSDPFVHKEPWSYTAEHEMITKQYLKLRHQLFPYLYTMNYRNHTQLVPLVQPMYYSHPKCSGAYEVPTQFWFGSELIVAPITEKNDDTTMMGGVEAWLPAGNWFDFFRGIRYASRKGRKLQLYRQIQEYPVLAKAGAIIPMKAHEAHDNSLCSSENMEIVIFPGADNTFVLYEDEGDGNRFEAGAFTKTSMQLKWGEEAEFTISPAAGDLTLIPESRKWKLNFRGFHHEVKLHVYVDGKECSQYLWTLDDATNTQTMTVHAPVTSEIQVKVTGRALIHDNADARNRCLKILQRAQINFLCKNQAWKVLQSDTMSIHDKMFELSCIIPDRSGLMGAVKEQLTLTEDEYTGSEI